MPAEFIKSLDSDDKKEYVDIGQNMYLDRKWQTDFCKSTLIPLQEKELPLDVKSVEPSV